MFASSFETALLSTGQAGGLSLTGVDGDSSFLFAFWCVLATVFISAGAVLLMRFLPEAKAPQSQRPSRAPAMPNPRCAQRLRAQDQDAPRSQRDAPRSERATPRSQRDSSPISQRSVPRRVIRLHAVTPGQAEHEYNVGDPLGTRGSALIRVA